MEMKKLSNLVAIVLGLTLLAIAANAQMDCVTGMLPTLLPCQSFLANYLPILPSQQCCIAAQNVSVNVSPANLCQCLKLNISGSGILPLKLNLIPNLCSLPNLYPLVGCVLQGTTTNTPTSLPGVPLTPLPGVASPVVRSEHQAAPPANN